MPDNKCPNTDNGQHVWVFLETVEETYKHELVQGDDGNWMPIHRFDKPINSEGHGFDPPFCDECGALLEDQYTDAEYIEIMKEV